jgi:hypothetical protein
VSLGDLRSQGSNHALVRQVRLITIQRTARTTAPETRVSNRLSSRNRPPASVGRQTCPYRIRTILRVVFSRVLPGTPEVLVCLSQYGQADKSTSIECGRQTDAPWIRQAWQALRGTAVKHRAWLVEGGRAADSTSSEFVQVSPFAIFVRDR